MENRNIIGREKEMSELQRCLDSDRSELVIVYGRRRVGKTFLIDQFFQGRYDFTFVGGHKLSQRIQLRNFAKVLKQAMNERLRVGASAGMRSIRNYKDWFDAFDALEEFLESLPTNRKKVVFIDEMPWIDSLLAECHST